MGQTPSSRSSIRGRLKRSFLKASGICHGVRDWEAASLLLSHTFVGVLEFPWVRISAHFLPNAFRFKLQRPVQKPRQGTEGLLGRISLHLRLLKGRAFRLSCVWSPEEWGPSWLPIASSLRRLVLKVRSPSRQVPPAPMPGLRASPHPHLCPLHVPSVPILCHWAP